MPRSRLRSRLPLRWLALALVLSLSAVARADDPTLHEYVPDVEEDEGSAIVSSGGEEPEAIVHDGEVIPAPTGGPMRRDEQPMRASPGDGEQLEEPGRRSPTFRPDRVTELNGTIPYYSVFSPGISPFKRVTALDQVRLERDGTPILALAPSPAAPVEVLGANAPSPDGRPRDRFWGNVMLDFQEASRVPLPSVAPESRVLTLRTEPEVSLRVLKDGADNFYVEAPPGTPRLVRAIFLMDAPRTYFGTHLPRTRADALADRLRPLPPEVQRQGETFASELGLRRDQPFHQVLSVLVEHFRSFEEAARPPDRSPDIYLDLARGMKGVCRHRAYAFVITAHSLGMEARFVQNEAHAFVEVHLSPQAGWLRVDLGGSPTALSVRGGDRGPSYNPDVPDPLPRPEPYVRAYAEAMRNQQGGAGGGPGGSSGQGGEVSAEFSAEAQEGAEPGTEQEPGAEQEPGTEQGDPQEAQQEAGDTPPGSDPGDNGGFSQDPERSLTPLLIAVDPPSECRGALSCDRPYSVLRGRTLDVSGRIEGSGEGVSGLRVEVLLRTERGGRERLLGVTVTQDGGLFRGSFGVPQDLAVGDYQLQIRTPGDQHWAPSIAR